MITDTHCHIDLYSNPIQLIKDCVKSNTTVIAMTNLPSHFEMGFAHFQSLKKIRLALGMHPLMAEEHKKEFKLFLKNIHNTSYIGEVGLDFSKEGILTKDIQIDSFTKILKLVSGQNKILSIHSRKAEKEVLELLIENNVKSAIFHWYSGSLNLINKIVEAGYFFSVNPSMIKSANGQKIISAIPISNLLMESDGPFVQINKKPLYPWDLKVVLHYISINKQIDIDEVEIKIQSNFDKLVTTIK